MGLEPTTFGTTIRRSNRLSYIHRVVLPNPAEEKTAGGLIIPDTAKEKPLAGKVVAVGPGTSEVKMEVKVGDQVLYGKYAGQEIQVDGVDYLIMKQNDILAII